MFRSLFIGFLILSALTSKGVGVPIGQNTNLSAAMLLDLYNAAVAYADSHAGPADSKNDGAFRSSEPRTAFAIEQMIRTAMQDSQTAWSLPDDRELSLNPQCAPSENRTGSFCPGGTCSFGSDSSPPCCGNYD